MSDAPIRVSGDWLALREPADAAARARDLPELLGRRLAPNGGWLIHDLGGGTGSMGRWLAPLLPGPQHWVLHDRDEDLLALGAASPPRRAADGAIVTVEPRPSDILRLAAGDLAGVTLITASALLDMLTARELGQLVALCAGPGCPILFALSVTGQVEFVPADPLDRRITAAFNAHQRRDTDRGPLLGPDAVAFAAEAFARRDAEVLVRDSPWQLDSGSRRSALTTEWLRGWVEAACQQEPRLAAEAAAYSRRRLAQAAAGRLRVTVSHADLIILPRRSQSH
jgi:hypothetical protein